MRAIDPKDIFELIIKADERLKYAKPGRGDQRAAQAGQLLRQALQEAEAIGNQPLVDQAKVRLADLDAILAGGGASDAPPSSEGS